MSAERGRTDGIVAAPAPYLDGSMNRGPRYYRPDGSPYFGADPVLQWARDFEDRAAARVGLFERRWLRVSTVWLGLDHSCGDGPPLIFESMVFFYEREMEQARYSTRAEAELGHARLVKRWDQPEWWIWWCIVRVGFRERVVGFRWKLKCLRWKLMHLARRARRLLSPPE